MGADLAPPRHSPGKPGARGSVKGEFPDGNGRSSEGWWCFGLEPYRRGDLSTVSPWHWGKPSALIILLYKRKGMGHFGDTTEKSSCLQ